MFAFAFESDTVMGVECNGQRLETGINALALTIQGMKTSKKTFKEFKNMERLDSNESIKKHWILIEVDVKEVQKRQASCVAQRHEGLCRCKCTSQPAFILCAHAAGCTELRAHTQCA